MTTFTVDAFQNEYLPDGAAQVDAIVTVTAAGGTGAAVSGDGRPNAVIIIMDKSGSMEQPPDKIHAAKKATAEAIDEIRDGVHFAVIAGDDRTHQIYPRTGMAEARGLTRAEAMSAVKRIEPSGGTAMSKWLAMARDLFQSQAYGVRHAILLTDGKDESETPEELAAVLETCVGVFQCDCRGTGVKWEVAELRRIAAALLGTVDIIPKPSEMEAAFRAMMASAMEKQVADVALRIWVPQGAAIEFVRQVAPAIDDLTAKGTAVNAMTTDFPLGAWGDESRDYHVQVRVKPGGVGAEMLAARASLVSGADVVDQALVKAIWTDDEALSTRINAQVAHYTDQAELADAIQAGLEARKSGDDRTATIKLGRAVQLAHASGHEGTINLLRKVVTITDPETGTVRLKREVETADEMALDTRSTKTIRVGGKK